MNSMDWRATHPVAPADTDPSKSIVSPPAIRDAIDFIDIAMCSVDLSGKLTSVNGSLCRMFGLSESELVGKTFAELTFEDDLSTNLGYFDQLRRGEIDVYRMDKRYRRASGEVFWAELVVKRARSNTDGSTVGAYSAIIDISARKQAEERQAYLLGEVGHRTKNLIAVMSSLVKQTARTAGSVEEMASNLNGRLTAVSAAQNELVKAPDAQSVGIEQLCRCQMSAFLSPGDTRLSLSGPAIQIRAEIARSFGMAIYELGTNAVKYGALSVPTGHVEVNWNVDRPAGRLHLSWTESGGPPVQPPSRIGFGSKVIENMVGASSEGHSRLHFEPTGVRWTLDAPLDRVEFL